MRLALTGGATGIGAATVARLRADGHEIVIFDIQQPQGDERWIQLDLMDQGSMDAALQAADGHFDGLVSIAGIPPRDDKCGPLPNDQYAGDMCLYRRFHAQAEQRRCGGERGLARRHGLADKSRSVG